VLQARVGNIVCTANVQLRIFRPSATIHGKALPKIRASSRYILYLEQMPTKTTIEHPSVLAISLRLPQCPRRHRARQPAMRCRCTSINVAPPAHAGTGWGWAGQPRIGMILARAARTATTRGLPLFQQLGVNNQHWSLSQHIICGSGYGRSKGKPRVFLELRQRWMSPERGSCGSLRR
jgi:hypothetical protein